MKVLLLGDVTNDKGKIRNLPTASEAKSVGNEHKRGGKVLGRLLEPES